jgi:hypothetical protein
LCSRTISRENADTEKALIEHCHQDLIKLNGRARASWSSGAISRQTRIGKIDYKELVREHLASHA